MNSGNTVKTIVMFTALTILLMTVGRLVGGVSGMVLALIFALVLNCSSYWFSDKMVLRLSGAKEVLQGEQPDLYHQVEIMADRAGLPKPAIYIICSPTPNAFATGRSPSHASVAVTTGLIEVLSKDEVSAVLAHELAHVANRDTLIATVVAAVAGAITMIASVAQWTLIFGGFGSSEDSEESNGVAGIITMLLMIILAPIAATLIQLAISRSREFAADAMGARVHGDPLPLARALEKLEAANQQVPLSVNPAIGHQFIVRALPREGFSRLFSTHPSTTERVSKLQEMALRPDSLRW